MAFKFVLSLGLLFIVCVPSLQAQDSSLVWQYKEIQKGDRDVALAHYNRGLFLEMGEKHEDAISHYQTALMLFPGFIEARNNLGAAYYNLGMMDDAVVELRRVIQAMPTHKAARYNLASTYFTQGRFKNAIHEYKAVLDTMPDSYDAQYYLGICYNQIGEFKLAVRTFETLLHEQQDNPDVSYQLATNLFAMRQMARALEFYERTLSMDPNYKYSTEIHTMIEAIHERGLARK